MKKLAIFLILVSNVFIYNFAFPQEQITIATYYPAPFGIYQELRSRRMAIGDNYSDSALHPWATTTPTPADEISQDADLVVEGNVGIGTLTPRYPLDVRRFIGTTADVEGNAGLSYMSFRDSNNEEIGFIGDSTIVSNNLGIGSRGDIYIRTYTNVDGTGSGTGGSDVAIITNAGDVGIGVGQTGPRAKLDVAGAVKIGSGGTCDSTKGGTLRYNSSAKVMEYCDETNWAPLGSRIITGSYTGDGVCAGGRRTITVPGVTADRPIKLLVITSGWDTSINGNYPGQGAAMSVPTLFKTDTTGTYEHYINADVSESRTSDSALAFETNGFSFARCNSTTPPALTNANKHGSGSLVITYHYFILN